MCTEDVKEGSERPRKTRIKIPALFGWHAHEQSAMELVAIRNAERLLHDKSPACFFVFHDVQLMLALRTMAVNATSSGLGQYKMRIEHLL